MDASPDPARGLHPAQVFRLPPGKPAIWPQERGAALARSRPVRERVAARSGVRYAPRLRALSHRAFLRNAPSHPTLHRFSSSRQRAAAAAAARRGGHPQSEHLAVHLRSRRLGAQEAPPAQAFVSRHHRRRRSRGSRGGGHGFLQRHREPRGQPMTPLAADEPMSGERSPALFLDFDNTITRGDVLDRVLERYSASEAWRFWEAEWQGGRLSTRECLERQTADLRVTFEELIRFSDGIDIDAAFGPLVSWTATHGIATSIVSDNFQVLIEAMLRRRALPLVPIYANGLAFTGNRL